jgi:hypothetical protein
MRNFERGRLRATLGAAATDAIAISRAYAGILVRVVEVTEMAIYQTTRERYVALSPQENEPNGSRLVIELRVPTDALGRAL